MSLALLAGASFILFSGTALAQDMEPRAYANTPVGLNMAGVGYVYSWGAVFVDPSLPIEDVDVDLNTVSPIYVRTLPIFGWASKLVLALPWVYMKGEGRPYGQTVKEERQGLADPRLRLNVNFIGAPATKLSEFRAYRQKTIVGATFELVAPLGAYNPEKAVNIGANRWSFAAEAGISQRIRRWTFEWTAGGIYFTENDEFLGTSTLGQDPVVYTDAHIIFAFKPVIWIAFDALWVWGGQSSIDGVKAANLQSNTRAGGTFSFPIARRHSLKLLYSNGVTTRAGADFRSVGISWVMNWGG